MGIAHATKDTPNVDGALFFGALYGVASHVQRARQNTDRALRFSNLERAIKIEEPEKQGNRRV